MNIPLIIEEVYFALVINCENTLTTKKKVLWSRFKNATICQKNVAIAYSRVFLGRGLECGLKPVTIELMVL